jgi:hypothetical protein
VSAKRLRALSAHFQRVKPTLKCAVCGNERWHATEILLVPAPPKPAEGTDMPVICLTCDQCFHVLMFDWTRIWQSWQAKKGSDDETP